MERQFSELSRNFIGCALEVHKNLGPGLLESTYQACLGYELLQKGIPHDLEHPLPVKYKTKRLDSGYRLDNLVDRQLIIELKSVDRLLPIHEAQILTYMKLANIWHGLLMNFNVRRLREGLKSFVL
jgi:GxxExxY protein